MTINALKRRLLVRQTLVSLGLLFGNVVSVIMARNTCDKRHVGVGHCPNIRILRDPDVAGHTITNRMFLLLVVELEGISFHPGRCGRRLRQ